MGQTIVLIGAIPGLLLLFCILLRMPVVLVALAGGVCLTMVETRVFGMAFLAFAIVRYFWLRAHPAPTGAEREEFLRREAEAKSAIYEADEEKIEEARLLDEKHEEEWVAKSRRKPSEIPPGEVSAAMRQKVRNFFGQE